jgi:CheY-like chemotaxis protein
MICPPLCGVCVTNKGKTIPAVAFTAFNRTEDQERAFNAGFQGHLSKPVTLEVLVETIAGMITLPSDLPD